MTARPPKKERPANIGSLHPAAKIKETDVKDIRASKDTLTALSTRYGLSIAQMHRIKTGKSWTHVR